MKRGHKSKQNNDPKGGIMKIYQRIAISTLAILAGQQAIAQGLPFDGVTLRVNGYGGQYDQVLQEHVAKPLKEKYGIDVVYTAGSSSADAVKLIASRSNPPYDLFMTDSPNMPRLIEAGVIEPVTAADAPSLSRVNPELRNFEEFGVPTSIAAVVPIYNADVIKEPLTRYSDLGRADLSGQVAFQSPGSIAGALTLLAFAEENGGSVDNMDPGFELLGNMRANIVATPQATVNLLQIYTNGEANAGSFWEGRVPEMRASGLNMEAVTPADGIYAVVTYVSPVVNNTNPEAVKLYLEQALSDEAQVAMAKALNYAPATDVTLPDEAKGSALTREGDDKVAVRNVDWTVFARERGAWLDRFNQVMR